MQAGFKTLLINSFCLWLDDYIVGTGQAYTNISSLFYRQNRDTKFPQLSIYNSPYKQWVNNYNVVGAIIPSGISGSNGFLARNTSGLKIDFQEGRVLLNTGVSSNFSGTYAVKDFNLYVANNSEESVVFNTAYKYNPEYGTAYSGAEPYKLYLPGIFVNIPNGLNEPFAFGGMDKNTQTIRLTVIGDNYKKIINLLSLLEDSARRVFPLVYENDLPLNIFGDYKSGLYNYDTVRSQAIQNGNPYVYIDHVSASIFSDKTLRSRDEIISFVEFELCSYRHPRQ